MDKKFDKPENMAEEYVETYQPSMSDD